MDMRARARLDAVVARFGESIVRDPHRFEGALRDACGDQFRREVRVLVLAARDGIAGELLDAKNDRYPELALARLTSRLADANSLEASAARWSVESLALALKIAVPVPANPPLPPVAPNPPARPVPRATTPAPAPPPAPAAAPPPARAPATARAAPPAPVFVAPPAAPVQAPMPVPAPTRSGRRTTVILLGGVIALGAWAYRHWQPGDSVPLPTGDASAPVAQVPAHPLDPWRGAPSAPGSTVTAAPAESNGKSPTAAPPTETAPSASAASPSDPGLHADSPPAEMNPNVRLLVQKAEAALSEGALDAADAYVKAALAVEPDNPEAKRVAEQVLARKPREKS